jgi:hypothetical protein
MSTYILYTFTFLGCGSTIQGHIFADKSVPYGYLQKLLRGITTNRVYLTPHESINYTINNNEDGVFIIGTNGTYTNISACGTNPYQIYLEKIWMGEPIIGLEYNPKLSININTESYTQAPIPTPINYNLNSNSNSNVNSSNNLFQAQGNMNWSNQGSTIEPTIYGYPSTPGLMFSDKMTRSDSVTSTPGLMFSDTMTRSYSFINTPTRLYSDTSANTPTRSNSVSASPGFYAEIGSMLATTPLEVVNEEEMNEEDNYNQEEDDLVGYLRDNDISYNDIRFRSTESTPQRLPRLYSNDSVNSNSNSISTPQRLPRLPRLPRFLSSYSAGWNELVNSNNNNSSSNLSSNLSTLDSVSETIFDEALQNRTESTYSTYSTESYFSGLSIGNSNNVSPMEQGSATPGIAMLSRSGSIGSLGSIGSPGLFGSPDLFGSITPINISRSNTIESAVSINTVDSVRSCAGWYKDILELSPGKIRPDLYKRDEDFSQKAGCVPTRWSRRNKNSAQPPLKPIKEFPNIIENKKRNEPSGPSNPAKKSRKGSYDGSNEEKSNGWTLADDVAFNFDLSRTSTPVQVSSSSSSSSSLSLSLSSSSSSSSSSWL